MVTSTEARPRSEVVMAGVSKFHILVSATITKSAARVSRSLVSNSFRDGLPHSSSPSSSTVRRTGSVPVTARCARTASMKLTTWPLSSTAPRATMRWPRGPSSRCGSNGSVCQRSSGSAGCTS